MPTRAEQAQILRKQYQYRRLILSGRTQLPRKSAVRLVGPDCAYHLYRHHDGEAREK
jgi:hypothetical protein